MGAEPSPTDVRDRLDRIVDPCSEARGTDISIVEMGLLKRIEIEDGVVEVELRITSPSCMMVGYFLEQANELVGSLPGVEEVQLETDAGLSWREDMMAEEATEKRREHQESLAEKYRQGTDGVTPETESPAEDSAQTL